MFSKELQIMSIENRIKKLELNFDNAKLVAKAKRRLNKIKHS